MSTSAESAFFFDAHCHYQNAPCVRGSADVRRVRASMEKRGLRACVVNGTSPDDWEKVASFARDARGWAMPAFGMHPWQLPRPEVVVAEPENGRAGDPFWTRKLRAFLSEFPEAPVGEVGLDFSKKRLQATTPVEPPKESSAEAMRGKTAAHQAAAENQKDALAHQLRLARELNRVVILHCVDAFGPLKTLLQEIPPPRGFLMHGYCGSAEYARELVPFGAYFSFSRRNLFGTAGGTEITTKARTLLRTIPFGRLLLESDAPTTLPNGSDPQCHEELLSGKCAEELSQLHAHTANFFGIPIIDFHRNLHANFTALFGSPKPRA